MRYLKSRAFFAQQSATCRFDCGRLQIDDYLAVAQDGKKEQEIYRYYMAADYVNGTDKPHVSALIGMGFSRLMKHRWREMQKSIYLFIYRCAHFTFRLLLSVGIPFKWKYRERSANYGELARVVMRLFLSRLSRALKVRPQAYNCG